MEKEMKESAAPAAIAACAMVFYWVPMTLSSTSIQWDAADVHYPIQRYFSDRFSPRQFPFWTPYVLPGYPILANPEVGAWYPLNWSFFLAGITPLFLEHRHGVGNLPRYRAGGAILRVDHGTLAVRSATVNGKKSTPNATIAEGREQAL
jgi:hypothetical protein